MTCPDCERNRYRAALWRAEAYKQSGHDVIERPWVGLTDEDLIECERLADIRHRKHIIRGQQLSPAGQFLWHYARAIEASLKEKNHAN